MSITKFFTAIAVMQLWERKLVDLHVPVIQYLPECIYCKDITIHHLLTHTSCLPNSWDFSWYSSKEFWFEQRTDEDLLKLFSDKPLVAPPGKNSEYCNTGFMFLGAIIERISGTSFPVFLEENVLKPAEMHDTGCEDLRQILPNRAKRYIRTDDIFQNMWYMDLSNAGASGNMYSTVEDMLRFHNALQCGLLLKQETLDLMYTPSHLSDGTLTEAGSGWSWGYGCATKEIGDRVVNNNGGVYTLFATYTRHRDMDLMIFVASVNPLLNPESGHTVESIAFSIFNMCLKDDV